MFRKMLKRAEVYKKIFESEDGKALIRSLEAEIQPYRMQHTAGDPYQTAFNEGRRSVYNHILFITQQDPRVIHRYIQQYKEQEELAKLAGQDSDDLF